MRLKEAHLYLKSMVKAANCFEANLALTGVSAEQTPSTGGGGGHSPIISEARRRSETAFESSRRDTSNICLTFSVKVICRAKVGLNIKIQRFHILGSRVG